MADDGKDGLIRRCAAGDIKCRALRERGLDDYVASSYRLASASCDRRLCRYVGRISKRASAALPSFAKRCEGAGNSVYSLILVIIMQKTLAPRGF
jgi:hypothetical protein